eukprot:Em0001g728a
MRALSQLKTRQMYQRSISHLSVKGSYMMSKIEQHASQPGGSRESNLCRDIKYRGHLFSSPSASHHFSLIPPLSFPYSSPVLSFLFPSPLPSSPSLFPLHILSTPHTPRPAETTPSNQIDSHDLSEIGNCNVIPRIVQKDSVRDIVQWVSRCLDHTTALKVYPSVPSSLHQGVKTKLKTITDALPPDLQMRLCGVVADSSSPDLQP